MDHFQGATPLNKWVTAHRDTDVVPDKDLDLVAQENELLRRENRILKEKREILKKATQFFAGQKPRGPQSLHHSLRMSVRGSWSVDLGPWPPKPQ